MLLGIKNIRSLICIVTILLGAMFVSGCAGQQVALNYHTIGASMPASGLPEVQIAEFQNNLNQSHIGVNSSGEYFEAVSPPTQWATRAFTDELVRLGVKAGYGGGKAVTGSLDQLWIEQTGPGQYKARVSITVRITEPNGASFHQNFNSEQSDLFLPSDSNISELLESTLRNVTVPAAEVIKGRLR